jgi:hypothetical protein
MIRTKARFSARVQRAISGIKTRMGAIPWKNE